MDTLLENGDHGLSPQGLPISLVGSAEIIQQAMIRLGVKKGSFPYDSELGSQLYRLQGGDDSLNQMALSYAQEALRPMEKVRVLEADCLFLAPDDLKIKITLEVQGKINVLEVSNNRVLQ